MVSLLAQYAVTNCFRSILPSDSVFDIDNFFSHSYIGDIDSGRERRYEQYAQYAQPQDDLSARPFRPEALEEFKEALHANSLNADDVDGIRKLTESAHIGRNLTSGPYKGFHHGTKAKRILHRWGKGSCQVGLGRSHGCGEALL
jgi:hypothetical protein